VLLPELPMTPHGKVDRKALRLPAAARARTIEPRGPETSAELVMTQIWEDVLSRRPLSLDDDFFRLGGHSLLGASLLARVERAFQRRLPLASLFLAPTAGKMLELIRKRGGRLEPSSVIPLSGTGAGTPLVLLGLQPLFRSFLLHLPMEWPVFAIGNVAADQIPVPFRLADIAASQVAALNSWRPEGPLILGGWCLDGVLVYEIAQQLRAGGRPLPLVVMFDSYNPRTEGQSPWLVRGDRLLFHLRNLARLDSSRVLAYGRERWQTLSQDYRSRKWRAEYRQRLREGLGLDPQLRDPEQIMRVAALDYEPLPYPGAVLLLRPAERPPSQRADAARGWRKLAPRLQVVDVPGNHTSMFREPNVERMAEAVRTAIEQSR